MWHSERLCLRVACVIALPPFVLAAFADPPLFGLHDQPICLPGACHVRIRTKKPSLVGAPGSDLTLLRRCLHQSDKQCLPR